VTSIASARSARESDAQVRGATRRRRVLQRVALACAASAAVLGATVLVVGWALGSAVARSVVPGLAHMAPVTAFAFVTAGAALLLLAWRQDTAGRLAGEVLAAITTTVGLIVLAEYILGADLGIDTLLFRDALEATSVADPGRPALNTAAGFVFVGMSLLFFAREGPGVRLSQWLALAAGFISLQTLIGYAYGTEALYRVGRYSSIALHTAAGLLLMSTALLCIRPHRGLVGQLTADDAGGFVARRLLPVTLLVPVVFGWLGLKAVQRGSFSVELGITLIVVAAMVSVAAAVWASTRVLSGMDRRRRAADSTLRENVARLSKALEMSPFPVMVHAEDGSILQLSRAWTELSGYDLTDIPDLHDWTRRAYGARAAAARDQLRSLYELGGRVTDTAEHVIRTKSGETRIWSFSSGPLGRLGDGRRLVISAAVDVTDRTRSELELRRTNERLGFLFDATSRLLASADPQQLVEAVYSELAVLMDLDVYFNYIADVQGGRQRLRLASWSGVPAEAVAGVEWLDFGQAVCGTAAHERRRVVVEHVQDGDDPMAILVRGLGVSAYVCFPLIAREELVGTISFGAFRRPAFPADELALLQAVADQIALALERGRSYERERAARRSAEEASRAKDQFLAVVSHELRTPLTAVVGYTDLLEADVDGSLSATHRKFVGRIRESAWSLASVIDDILTFARTQARQERVRMERTHPAIIAREAVTLVQPEADRKGLRLTAAIPEPAHAVHLDGGKLRRIILNLLGNAVKFTDEGEVHLSVELGSGELRVTIRDTGPGIPPDYLDRIFEPFIQVDASETRTKSGTGLGLTITRELARLLDGSVSVTSEYGSGATFTVELPAPPAD
jgi:PAS domain S-box-containing protein